MGPARLPVLLLRRSVEPMIPAEAVEVAARAMNPAAWGPQVWTFQAHGETPTEARNRVQQEALQQARAALEAAAPHMLEDKRGDGDYRPGWDDRKTLSSLWQKHAPLPDEGLSERVYEALIAVATWGYQQRKDEEL